MYVKEVLISAHKRVSTGVLAKFQFANYSAYLKFPCVISLFR